MIQRLLSLAYPGKAINPGVWGWPQLAQAKNISTTAFLLSLLLCLRRISAYSVLYKCRLHSRGGATLEINLAVLADLSAPRDT